MTRFAPERTFAARQRVRPARSDPYRARQRDDRCGVHPASGRACRFRRAGRGADGRLRCVADADRGDHRPANRRIRVRRGLPAPQRLIAAQHIDHQFLRLLRDYRADTHGRSARSREKVGPCGRREMPKRSNGIARDPGIAALRHPVSGVGSALTSAQVACTDQRYRGAVMAIYSSIGFVEGSPGPIIFGIALDAFGASSVLG
jgi:hypothetical protein